MAVKKTQVLIIDPQFDFCNSNGSLYVPGSEDDMDRLASMVSRLKGKIDDIHVTLDSHHFFDVAHPIYWVNSSGKSPDPFTFITPEDIENGTWQPKLPNLFKRSLDYVKSLKTGNRYQLCIWPVHCRIGTEGNMVVPKLMDALTDWEQSPNIVSYVTKGSNPFTEHYSAVQAEVPDPKDPATQLNTELIKTIMEADETAIGGEAGSHCVASTLLDIANSFGDDSYIKKMVFLTDAASPVPLPGDLGRQMQDNAVSTLVKRGMRTSTTKEWLS